MGLTVEYVVQSVTSTGSEFESQENGQSDDELESGDQLGELEETSDDVTSDHSEDDQSEDDQPVSPAESEEEEEVEGGNEVKQNGILAVSMDTVQQDLEKGRAVREQISEWEH